jgi:hypothetical protein
MLAKLEYFVFIQKMARHQIIRKGGVSHNVVLSTLHMSGIELTTLVVIDCIAIGKCSCKFNYHSGMSHMITTPLKIIGN